MSSYSGDHATAETHLPGRTDNLFVRLADSIDVFYQSSLRVDLAEALIPGLLIASVLAFINGESMRGMQWQPSVRLFFSTLGCYLLAALLLHYFWKGQLRRLLPTWVLIPVLGAILSLGVYMLPGIIAGWDSPNRADVTLDVYLSRAIRAWRFIVILFSLITIPIAALIHYSNHIIRGLRS